VNKKMNKKGQAAMEFLMTYGWAILVVLAAIAALAYFGVLSPSNMLPERTTFAAPIQSIDSVISASGDDVTIVFRNNVGTRINLTTQMTGGDDCAVNTNNIAITGNSSGGGAGLDTWWVVGNGDQFTLSYNCTETLSTSSRFRASLTFNYTNLETGLTRPHSGTINSKVNP